MNCVSQGLLLLCSRAISSSKVLTCRVESLFGSNSCKTVFRNLRQSEFGLGFCLFCLTPFYRVFIPGETSFGLGIDHHQSTYRIVALRDRGSNVVRVGTRSFCSIKSRKIEFFRWFYLICLSIWPDNCLLFLFG